MSVRFAPSPTGDFHVGNFRTAWISHEWARALSLPWIVRFEDIDQPRVVRGARERQLDQMRRLGLHPDRVLLQSEFHARHRELFDLARRQGRIYPCDCSRKEVQEALRQMSSAPHLAPAVYNGACRPAVAKPGEDAVPETESLAWRFRCDDVPDGSQDFIVARTEKGTFSPAYHWACAIDDHDGAHRLLVRAWDLASVIEQHRRIHLWMNEFSQEMGTSVRSLPAVFHTALVVQNDGHRLEKRTRGVTWDDLMAAGETADTIAARFRASFSADPRAFSESRVWGELKRELTLQELGLVPGSCNPALP